jgi:hypothetical protein
MTNKYGPQTYQIEKMLERIKILTTDEITRLQAARSVARYASQEAVSAVSVRHLIGQYGFTLEHYNIQTKPWRHVIGEFEEWGSENLSNT